MKAFWLNKQLSQMTQLLGSKPPRSEECEFPMKGLFIYKIFNTYLLDCTQKTQHISNGHQ
jgi:hypothetical protein